jgi:hypothetical protein
MTRHLDAVRADLQVGLRNRAIRRRRARTAATGSTTLVLVVAALAGTITAQQSAPALAYSVGPSDAALVLRGCDVLNLPKAPQEEQQSCVVP